MARYGRYGYRRYVEFDGKKLNEAFRRFRKAGLVARQNFSCCGGCAGYEIASHLGTKLSKVRDTKGQEKFEQAKAKVKGCVFYHRQNTQYLQESGKVYLAYGSVDSEEVGEIGLPTVEVGRLITGILDELGIRYEWDGHEHSTILMDVRFDYQVERDEETERRRAERKAELETRRQEAKEIVASV